MGGVPTPSSRAATAAIPIAAVAVTVCGAVAAVWARAGGTGDTASAVSLGLTITAVAIAGAVLTLSRPDNRVGWVMLAAGAIWGIGEGAFVSEVEKYMCLPAAMQVMINIMKEGPPDRSAETQWRLYEAARAYLIEGTYVNGETGAQPEGWANVLLEAMACGLPVVATDVGGNAEVVRSRALGTVVPFGDAAALETALDDALARHRDGAWDTGAIRRYAADNAWPRRIERLVSAFTAIDGARRDASLAGTASEGRHA